MSDAKLLNCPFCGGEAEMCDAGIAPSCYWIYCKECGCKQPPSIHREAVINAWNTRKPMERIVEKLEEARKPCNFLRMRIDEAIKIVKEEGKIK